MKNDLVLSLAYALAIPILAACAVPTPTPATLPSSTPQGKPTPSLQASPVPARPSCPDGIVTVRMDDWSNTDEARAAMTEVLSAFKAAHPCIEVETVEQAPEGADAIRLRQIQAGTASDLIGVDSMDIPIYTEAGGLADLAPFVEADPDFDPETLYFESVWEAGFYKGTPRAINKDFSTSAIYINVSLFEQAGLSIPKEGWTYDDYLKIALELTLDQDGRNANDPAFDPARIVQYGTTIPYWGGGMTKAWFRGFENVLYSFGTHVLNPEATSTVGYLNSEKAVRAWQFYRDLVHTYHVSPTPEQVSAAEGNDVLFKNGQLAMSGNYWGPWYEEAFDATPGLKWVVVPLPSGLAGHRGAIMWMGWGLNQKTAHPREAWQLLEWLVTEPGQRAFSRRALTQVKSLAVELQRINDPFWGVFLAETEYLDPLDDAAHPRFFPCIADGPPAEFLLKTWQAGGDALDIQAELDKLAAEADVCLASGQ